MNEQSDKRAESNDDRILVGYIAKPVGLRGRVRVKPMADLLNLLQPDSRVQVETPRLNGNNIERELTIDKVREDKDLAVIEFREVRSRDDAEGLRRSEIYISRDQLPVLEEDAAWYEADLLGCAVVNGEGKRLGILDSILETGANDVFQVMDDENEILIPAIRDAIQSVDLEAKTITVNWPDDWTEA